MEDSDKAEYAVELLKPFQRRRIKKQLKELAAQSSEWEEENIKLKDYEVVIVDNGSSVSTCEQLMDFMEFGFHFSSSDTDTEEVQLTDIGQGMGQEDAVRRPTRVRKGRDELVDGAEYFAGVVAAVQLGDTLVEILDDGARKIAAGRSLEQSPYL